MLTVVREKFVSDAWYVQRLKVACAEAVQRASLARELCLLDLYFTSCFVREIPAELTVYSVHLSIRGILRKERILEELTEDVQSLGKLLILDIKVIVGVVFTSCRVLHASMRLDELGVVVLLGELLGAQEEHMLTKVRQSVSARRVVEATRVDMKSSSGFLSLCVLDEQALELIGQFDIPVVALVAWAFSQ